MLELTRVNKNFGGLPALDEVSFSLNSGEITALIGPNGAGKSTLINCVSGIIPCDSGKIIFKDQDISRLPAHKITRLGMTRTFQNFRLVPRLSVLDNVLCGLTVQAGRSFVKAMLRLPATRHQERRLRLLAQETLDLFGIIAKADWPLAALPYGDKKRVEMARAFVGRPDIVLLDEPVAGLNPEETSEIAVLIKQMRRNGYTMLLVEHDMELVMEVSDQVVVLDSGRLIAGGTPGEISRNPLVLEAYLGKIGAAA